MGFGFTVAAGSPRGLDAERVVVLPIGGAHAITRCLMQFGPAGAGLRLAGLCDAGEADVFRRGLASAGIGSPGTRDGTSLNDGERAIGRPEAADRLDPRSRAAAALRMSRREMLGERQVAAPLMAQRAAHGALRPAHGRFQPGAGVGVQLAGLRLSGKPQRPSQCHF